MRQDEYEEVPPPGDELAPDGIEPVRRPRVHRSAEGRRGPKRQREVKVSQATLLVQLAEARYRFAQADDGRPFAVPLTGPQIARPLTSSRTMSLRTELANLAYRTSGITPGSSALADAMAVLDGRAAEAPRERLYLRTAQLDDEILVDLGCTPARVVVIGPAAWRIVDEVEVVFRRTELTEALPEPLRAGRLDRLRELVNVADTAWPLLVGWLLSTLFDIPRPLLFLTGEQGTGKSTAAKTLAQLVDPTPAALRSAPRDLDAWVVAAAGSQVVALDNLSTVSEWLSDALCRAATGEGLVRRALYTDDGLSVLTFRRSVILTSIDAGALRGDLGERLVPVELERIPSSRRRTDAALEAEFSAARPEVLGALFDLAVEVIRVLPTIDVADLPRMADFGRLLAAVDQVTGWDSLGQYRAAVDQVAADVVQGDPLAVAIVDLVDRLGGSWSGTAAELLRVLHDARPDSGPWPRNVQALGGQLKRLAPALRSQGIEVEARKSNGKRWVRLIATGTTGTTGTTVSSVEGDEERRERPTT